MTKHHVVDRVERRAPVTIHSLSPRTQEVRGWFSSLSQYLIASQSILSSKICEVNQDHFLLSVVMPDSEDKMFLIVVIYDP
jgi:hypothetical protein